ncbi:beta-glucuronidase [Bifidobacterium tissieri]|uniref:Beta-glucuronidase n=2 Tax=Bifidobacterium tissieri TaxID=1630162 RepID=A0A5M9ZSV0_9BIFI|nr:beta-glucuronidase [Bifidobacterium tissieri]KAA8830610.1 beta-glucuronidase [Bifidobacterium tissieri]
MMFDSLYPRLTATRRIQNMCGTWRFQFDPRSEGVYEGWEHGLPDPIDVPVPSSFADLFTDKASREYTGDFWYETDLFVPGEWRDANVGIRFDAATHRATVYVNGVEVARHEGGFTPFVAPINDVVNWNGVNTVVVKMNNELGLDTLPAGETKILPDGTKVCAPYFDFYNYSGLQRPVRLVVSPRERIEDFAVVSRFDGDDALVDYTVDTNGDHDVEIVVTDEDGMNVARGRGKAGTLRIENVIPWQLRNAYLYTFTVRIVDDADDGRVIDEYYDEIGIRTIVVDGTRLLLNGRPIYLKGFGRHEDSDIHGRGFDPVMNKRDFENLKWIGANSFRTSHYPYAEEQLYEADREGFLVIDEVAAVGMMKSLVNFLDATDASKTKEVTFFDEPVVQTDTLAAHLQAVRELIDRDKRHACVGIWSLFNEPDSASNAAVPYFRKVFDLALDLDPQKRPRSYTNVTACGAGKDKCHDLCDVIMLNRYNGWYVEGGVLIHEAARHQREELELWHELEPNKPFLFTEYGGDTMAGVHKLPSVMWSEEYQVENLTEMATLFDAFDWIVGEQAWNLNDFQTTEGIMRVNGNKKGLFTRDRQPKMAAYYLRDRWTAMPDYLE